MAKSSLAVPKAWALITFGVFLLFANHGEGWMFGIILIVIGAVLLSLNSIFKK